MSNAPGPDIGDDDLAVPDMRGVLVETKRFVAATIGNAIETATEGLPEGVQAARAAAATAQDSADEALADRARVIDGELYWPDGTTPLPVVSESDLTVPASPIRQAISTYGAGQTGPAGPAGTVGAFTGDAEALSPGAGVILASRGGGAHRVRLYVDADGALAFEEIVAPPPNAPTGVAAAALSPTSARVTWTDASTDETGFEVQRSLSSSSWGAAVTTAVGPGVVASTASGLAHGTTYYFRVRSVRFAVPSAWSATVSAATPATPADDTLLKAWYSAPDLTGLADAAPVASFTNLETVGGTARNATQATASKQPTWRANARNSLAVVRFDGDDVLHTAAFLRPDSAQDTLTLRTVYVAAKLNTAGTSRTIADGIATGARAAVYVDATDHLSAFANTVLTGPVVTPATDWHVFAVTFNGTSSALRVDGGTPTTGNAGTSTMSGVSLGGSWSDATPAAMDLGEAFVIAADYDAKYVTYLKTRWGIA